MGGGCPWGFVEGRRTGASRVCPSFTVNLSPALQGVRLGDSVTGTVLPKPSHALRVEAGCSVPSPCDSSPCPANSICKDEWQSYSCVCQPGRACSALPPLCPPRLSVLSSPPVAPSWPVTALLSIPWASCIPVRPSLIFLEGRIPPEPRESTPWCSGISQGEGACFTWCSLSTPQGTTEGTVWMCVTSTLARTSQCVAASQGHPWATCASVEGTFSGSTASTGEMRGTRQGRGLCAWLCAALSSWLHDQGPLSATRLIGAAEQLGWWEEKAQGIRLL